MILAWLIIILFAGGILAWVVGRKSPLAARIISLVAIGINLVLGKGLWFKHADGLEFTPGKVWLEEITVDWIPRFGIQFHLGLDGLSLILILLTFFLGIISVLASWKEVQKRVGFFHFNLLWVLAGVVGVFLALDLFLFYFFWEVMLIPMYLLIGIWGHENRVYAAIKFFLFTQASGLLMFFSILSLVFLHQQATGSFTFNYNELLGTSLSPSVAMLLMLGFFIAFAVKLPVVPFHTWLPDAHTQAPTAGSVILAGLLLKTGGYGLMRFVVPLFPDAAMQFAPIAMGLGVIGILYGALMAFAQTDLKRLIAYTSISHLGFVILGVFAWNQIALQGAVMQMVCHGMSAAALFILVGQIYERTHTRNLKELGGLWAVAPRMGAVAMFFTMASLGLPGLGNFVGEMLTLFGTFQTDILMTFFATTGLVLATVYSLYMMQHAFLGKNHKEWKIPDLNVREMIIMGLLMLSLVGLGLYPQHVLNTAAGAIENLEGPTSISAQVTEVPHD